jgi:hypothetical protein
MTSIGVLQIVVFFGLILAVTKPVGLFMSHVFQGERFSRSASLPF